ncbi:hypothetical protein HID58_057302, partial [Brassica napus]
RCLHAVIQIANAKEEDDSAERAATVAANLISSARLILKLDSEFTEYSPQFLVDNALVVKEPVQGPPRSTFTTEDCLEHLVDVASPKTDAELEEMEKRRCKITVKDCLECAFKEGIPRREHWAHLGCVSKVPPYASLMPRVPVKGEVIEVKKLEDALELLKHGPIGAKLHVFSPDIDRVGEDGVYQGMAGAETRYVGLRDVIIGGVDKVNGVDVATVKICYKKRTSLMKVALNRMIMLLQHHADESQSVEPTRLLVDFIKMSSRCHPNCQRAAAAKEDDSAERAATVAANLISTARVILKLDREFTEYSAQFLVDNALVEKVPSQGPQRSTFKVEDCLEYLVNMASPKTERWRNNSSDAPRSLSRTASSAHSRKGYQDMGIGLIWDAKELKDAFELLEHGPVGAKLHVFSPEIDLVGENGVYRGPSSNGTSYVGLRDVILVAAEKIKGEAVGTVKIRYKKETSFMNVSLSQMFTRLAQSGDESQTIEPTGLLVDFIVLRLSHPDRLKLCSRRLVSTSKDG